MIRAVSSDGETGAICAPIERARLIERINSALANPVVLLIAPAGYGKSVALRQFCESAVANVIRFDVRAEHSSFLDFLRGFCDSIASVAPDLTKTLATAYEANSSSETCTRDLARWAYANMKQYSGVVVIDDLHILENEPRVTAFLASLIAFSKRRMKWIIASRSPLDLPVGSWLAYGDMDLAIDEHDLRFTLDETRAAARAAGVRVRDEELDAIRTLTDGWPTAISFALRCSARSVDLKAIHAGTRELIYQYLAEQVYVGLSQRERGLLHLTSFLDEIEVDVLKAAGYKKAKTEMDSLRQRVAFITLHGPGIYRCHDLFRSFVRSRLENETDSTVDSMRLRLARALESIERVPPALRLYAAAKSVPDVLRIVSLYGFELLEKSHADAIAEALQCLPHDIRNDHSAVLGLRGLKAAEAGRFDRAESLLRRAAQAATDTELRVRLSLRLAVLLANQGRNAVKVLENLPRSGVTPQLRAELISLLAVCYSYAGRVGEAEACIAAAERTLGDVEHNHERARILHRLGLAVSYIGTSAHYAFELQDRAATLALESGLFALAGRSFTALASIALFFEGDMSKEMWYAQKAMSASAKAGDRLNLQTAILQLIDIEGRHGNSERLRTLEQQLGDVATSDAGRISYIIPVRAMQLAWDGFFEEAHRLISTVINNERLFAFDRVLNIAVDALFLVGANRRDSAIDAVTKCITAIKSSSSTLPHGRRQLEIARLLCGAAEALLGRYVNAARIIDRRCLEDARSTRAFKEAASAVFSALKRSSNDFEDAMSGLSAVGFGGYGRLLELLTEQQLDSAVDSEEILTKTQLMILESLAEGKSPKEIARDKGRSVYTVQVHIKNIIGRLGCHGRNEALVIARNRGILA